VHLATTFAFRIYRHDFWGVDQLIGQTLGNVSATGPSGSEDRTSYVRHPDLEIGDAYVRTMAAELDRLDVTALSLANCRQVTESGIATVADLNRLRFLDLFNTSLTDQDLAHLNRCRELEVLNLAGTAIDGSVLHALADLPKLHTLHLGFTDLRSRHLAALPSLPALRRLDLSATPTGDAEVAVLAQCRALAELGLEETLISDRAIAMLEPLAARLTRLHLGYNAITDGCLTDLCRLGAVRTLRLRATHIDRSNTDRLLGALPNLNDGTADDAAGLVW
jgi:hypothetical protein